MKVHSLLEERMQICINIRNTFFLKCAILESLYPVVFRYKTTVQFWFFFLYCLGDLSHSWKYLTDLL